MYNHNLDDSDFIPSNMDGSVINRLYALKNMKAKGEVTEEDFITERNKIISGK